MSRERNNWFRIHPTYEGKPKFVLKKSDPFNHYQLPDDGQEVEILSVGSDNVHIMWSAKVDDVVNVLKAWVHRDNIIS